MTKAEERALEAYPSGTRDVTGFVIDIGHPQYMRDFYIEGYHQAEKDLALTWEDISDIMKIYEDVLEFDFCNDIYGEVAKRFNKMKNRE